VDRWDCIVVGGGAAGLSAALVLGRARRRTLLVDAGEPSNAPAEGIGGFLGQDGRPPAEFYAVGREELSGYPSVAVRSGLVTAGRGDAGGFALDLEDGASETARTVLLATGMTYRYPDIPGADERWGRSVFHCPFCHGWEVRERPLGVLASDARAVHAAVLLRAWTDDVTLFANGSQLETADAEHVGAAGVRIEERPVTGLRGEAPGLSAVVLDDGTEPRCEGLLIQATLRQRSELAWQLGATAAEPGPVAADAVAVDGMFATDVPGLFAAGDASAQMPSVAAAVASGSIAAAGVVRTLTGA
jgi:thioredoxin reductase